MRLPFPDRSTLTPEQKSLADDMRAGIAANFKGFTAVDRDGNLIGPWNPWLRFPAFGKPVWELVKAMSTSPKLAKPLREVAILVSGSKFNAAYELYAHVLVAELRGLSDSKIRTIAAGHRPNDLTEEEGLAYDMASALISGGVLPQIIYDQSVETFGLEATAEFIYLMGLYALVSVILNGFDVPTPAVENKTA